MDFDNSSKLGDDKTTKLLKYLDSKKPNICKNNFIKVENRLLSNEKEKIPLSNQYECNKNSYVKIESNISCFD